MLSHISSRVLVSRNFPAVLHGVARPATRPLQVSHALTRSFHPSAATWTAATTTKDTATGTKASTKADAKSKAAPKKKKVAKAKEDGAHVTVPSRYGSIPSRGPSIYTHWFAKYYLPTVPPVNTREGMIDLSREAGTKYKEVPEEEKRKIEEEVKLLRGEATKQRQEWINEVPPQILREINRRRKVKGKPLLHKTRPEWPKKPLSSFLRYMADVYARKTDRMPALDVAKIAAEEWKQMTDVEKEPYITASNKDWEEYRLKYPPATASNSAA